MTGTTPMSPNRAASSRLCRRPSRRAAASTTWATAATTDRASGDGTRLRAVRVQPALHVRPRAQRACQGRADRSRDPCGPARDHLARRPGVRGSGRRAGRGRADQPDPVRHATTATSPRSVMLFVAAQSPEMLGRDQRYRVLSLYFSRALLRLDYAIAKLAALVRGAPHPRPHPAGRHLRRPGPFEHGSRRRAASEPRLRARHLGIAVAIALLLGSIGLAIAAFTPRRAYATAAIIAVFIVPAVVADIVTADRRGATSRRCIVLIAPGSVLDGVNAFFFGTTTAGARGRRGGARRGPVRGRGSRGGRRPRCRARPALRSGIEA